MKIGATMKTIYLLGIAYDDFGGVGFDVCGAYASSDAARREAERLQAKNERIKARTVETDDLDSLGDRDFGSAIILDDGGSGMKLPLVVRVLEPTTLPDGTVVGETTVAPHATCRDVAQAEAEAARLNRLNRAGTDPGYVQNMTFAVGWECPDG